MIKRRIISVEAGVTRHPDKRMAEPVTLSIEEDEQVAIVGPNGAGKSRLVDILTGRYPLLGLNEVKYDLGEGLVSEKVKYLTFRDSYGEGDGAYYHQLRWNHHDIDEKTPRVGQLLGIEGETDERRSKTRRTLFELFHLEGLVDKYIITLSSGELRKFQLTKALLGAPKVLIIDNPFIGLDAGTRQQLAELLKALTERMGLTVVLVVSREEDIPSFVTHIVEVDGLRVMPKKRREEYTAKPVNIPVLDEERRRWIEALPEKDAGDFYPEKRGEILRFEGVTVRYGERTILRNLSWTVREGERWALTGENGAGKSTLLSLVCADNPQAYACDIRLFGHQRGSGESIWEIKRHIGYVSPELHRAYQKDVRAVDIVASGLSEGMGLWRRAKPEEEDISKRWMWVFGVGGVAERGFLSLSSGEQRLVLLARAFVKDPELLILDEPLHGLDAMNRQMVREVIETFCRRVRKTLVMVTHYEEELPPSVTHKLWLERQR